MCRSIVPGAAPDHPSLSATPLTRASTGITSYEGMAPAAFFNRLASWVIDFALLAVVGFVALAPFKAGSRLGASANSSDDDFAHRLSADHMALP